MKTPDGEISYEPSPGIGATVDSGAETAANKLQGTAAYIADLTKELSGLARGAGLETLAYLLDIAELEARAQTRRRP